MATKKTKPNAAPKAPEPEFDPAPAPSVSELAQAALPEAPSVPQADPVPGILRDVLTVPADLSRSLTPVQYAVWLTVRETIKAYLASH